MCYFQRPLTARIGTPALTLNTPSGEIVDEDVAAVSDSNHAEADRILFLELHARNGVRLRRGGFSESRAHGAQRCQAE